MKCHTRFFSLGTDEIWLFGRLSMPIQIRPWISEAPIKAAVLQSPGCFHTAAKTYTDKRKTNIGEMGNEFEEYFLLVSRIIIKMCWLFFVCSVSVSLRRDFLRLIQHMCSKDLTCAANGGLSVGGNGEQAAGPWLTFRRVTRPPTSRQHVFKTWPACKYLHYW